MKRVIIVFLCMVLFLGSCGENTDSTRSMIDRVRGKYSDSLGSVSIYYSDAEEGDAGYIDSALIAAMLGEGEEVPIEMQGVEEYAFLCSAKIELCEVWAVRCRTYSSAREIYSIFEKRKKLLCGPDYENLHDAGAAAGTTLLREGKHVFFAVDENGADIVRYLSCGE